MTSPAVVDTMRDRFVAVATDLLDEHERLALVLADISTTQFRESGATERSGARVFNLGIREQALVSFSAGLALAGMRPVVHTYAPFLVERPFEQVKIDLGHQGLGAVLVSIGASYEASDSGRTHHAPGDVALVATLPGWTIHVPGHPNEADALLRHEAARDGRAYVRLAADQNACAIDVTPGHFATVRRSAGGGMIVAIGPILDRVLAATADLDVTVLYAATVRPFDGEALRAAVAASGAVVLVEPYLEGTSAAEVTRALAATPHRLLSIGVPLVDLRRYGTRAEHDAAHGLDTPSLRARIEAFLAL